MKKIISVSLLLTLLVSVLPWQSVFAERLSSINIYSVNDNPDGYDYVDVELIKSEPISESNVAQAIERIFRNEYGFELNSVSYSNGTITIDYTANDEHYLNAGSSRARICYILIRETVFSCSFITGLDERVNGETQEGLVHYSFGVSNPSEYNFHTLRNRDYSGINIEEIYSCFYSDNIDYFNRVYTDSNPVLDAFLADVDNDKIPELLVAYDLYSIGMDVYKYQSGQVKMYTGIRHGRGTGLDCDFELLMYDDGTIKLHQSEYSDNGMNGSDWCASETHLITSIPEEYGENIYDYLTIYYTPGVVRYSTDFNHNNIDDYAQRIAAMQTITESESNQLIADFMQKVQSYVVISSKSDDDEGYIKNFFGNGTDYYYGTQMNRIWDIQKQRFSSTLATDAVGNYIVLQLNNPIMNVKGEPKAIDEGIGTTPIVQGGRTLVPIRAIIEAMGGGVSWDNKTQTVTLTYKENTIQLIIDSNEALVNGIKKQLDVAPVIIGGRTMLPIRFVTENLGCNVDWNDETQTITITY